MQPIVKLNLTGAWQSSESESTYQEQYLIKQKQKDERERERDLTLSISSEAASQLPARCAILRVQGSTLYTCIIVYYTFPVTETSSPTLRQFLRYTRGS